MLKEWARFRLKSWCGGPKESHVSQTNALIPASEQTNPQTALNRLADDLILFKPPLLVIETHMRLATKQLMVELSRLFQITVTLSY